MEDGPPKDNSPKINLEYNNSMRISFRLLIDLYRNGVWLFPILTGFVGMVDTLCARIQSPGNQYCSAEPSMSEEGWIITFLAFTIVGGVIGLYRNFGKYYEPNFTLEAENYPESKSERWNWVGILIDNSEGPKLENCEVLIMHLVNLETKDTIFRATRKLQWSAKSVRTKQIITRRSNGPIGIRGTIGDIDFDDEERKNPQDIRKGVLFWVDAAYVEEGKEGLFIPTWNGIVRIENPSNRYLIHSLFSFEYGGEDNGASFYGILDYGGGLNLGLKKITEKEYSSFNNS